MPEQPIPEKDPVVSQSFALHYVIATVLMLATLFWALWDEAYGQRPWKHYQHVFQERYSAFLKGARTQSSASQKELEQSGDYRKLDDAVKHAEETAKPRIKDINDKLRDLNTQKNAVQNVFTDKRAYVNAMVYEVETEESAGSKQSLLKKVAEYKGQQFKVEMPGGGTKKLNYEQLEDTYNDLKDQIARLNAELGDMLKPINELRAKRDTYISDHLVSLTPEQIKGVQDKVDSMSPEIHQINVPSANIVDRCESCHLGIREPLKLTAESMAVKGKKPDDYAHAFVSHPEKDLFSIHDPDQFGCSTCHQGNGRATTSVEKAHGNYEHWLWPLFKKENAEAGCQTCHAADMVLKVGDAGDVISQGKYLFRQRGCNGCHRYQGYDTEPEDLNGLAQQIKQIETQQKNNLLEAAVLTKQADNAASNEEANHLYGQAEALKISNSKLSGQIEQLDLHSHDLLEDLKKIGPDLKEIRFKLNKNWIPVWLHKPTDFRATTKMPNFRLDEDEIQAISAYLWQSALTSPELPHAKPGNAGHGKELFETRGCLACHSIGEGDQMQGGDFAANLSHIGEKANYDYIVRWVHNPRQRTRPYCPYEKKDIGPEDYAKHNLPYVFDFEHSTCPNDGHELQVEQMTVMPSLRLSQEDAEDVASYLVTLRKKQPSDYAAAAFMDDPKLKEKGKEWIRHYGCAGCHEIAGFEDEGRIGTELTAEGSKPIERLDFALFTEPATTGGKDPITGQKTGPWYNNKGFFEHKLAKPEIYDQGMIKSDLEELRMPDPHLTPEQIRALSTFLLGSQETSLPASYQYRPEDYRHDIQEGWWIVRKYNCMGCHQFMAGQMTTLMGMKRYQDPDWKEQLPPKLLTEGARVDPQWMMRFLKNPSLADADTNRNGVRPYLKVRMPTFYFSNTELRKLVRFFQALSQQPIPYTPPRLPLLTAQEQEMARSLFSSNAAPCLKCHATGDPNHDKTATAPNFLMAKERLKPGWVERWITDPQSISPGTSMPSGLFKREGDQVVFAGPTPPSFQGYKQDHTKLLVRYIFELTPEEQKRVSGRMATGAKTTGRASPPQPSKTAAGAAGSR